ENHGGAAARALIGEGGAVARKDVLVHVCADCRTAPVSSVRRAARPRGQPTPPRGGRLHHPALPVAPYDGHAGVPPVTTDLRPGSEPAGSSARWSGVLPE